MAQMLDRQIVKLMIASINWKLTRHFRWPGLIPRHSEVTSKFTKIEDNDFKNCKMLTLNSKSNLMVISISELVHLYSSLEIQISGTVLLEHIPSKIYLAGFIAIGGTSCVLFHSNVTFSL